MLPGSSLYLLLSNILNQFRTHLIGMSGDISKMFREVGLHQGDRDLHWISHRHSAGNIVDCRMKHLTFGITTSPYLASQVLRQHMQTLHQERLCVCICLFCDNPSSDFIDGLISGLTKKICLHLWTSYGSPQR